MLGARGLDILGWKLRQGLDNGCGEAAEARRYSRDGSRLWPPARFVGGGFHPRCGFFMRHDVRRARAEW